MCSPPSSSGENMDEPILSEDEWKKRLAPERFRVLREKGTEMPFSGELLSTEKEGVYSCAGCGNIIFSSEAKYDSGSGWPSFFDIIGKDRVEKHRDGSYGKDGMEITCARCRGHLGHLFDDATSPTGLRYCINSLSLEFHNKSDTNDNAIVSEPLTPTP